MSRGERVVRASVVESDYPAAWLDKSSLTVEHDDSGLPCECTECTTRRHISIQALCSELESGLDHFAIDQQIQADDDAWRVLIFCASLLRNIEPANSNSTAETRRPPAFAARGSSTQAAE